MKRFRGGLVFKAHRLVYHTTQGVRVIKKRGYEPHGEASVRLVDFQLERRAERGVGPEKLEEEAVNTPASGVVFRV